MRPVVLYDADCNFCATVAAALASWDRGHKLRFATIQGPVGDELLADLPPAARLESFHFIDDEGARTSGGAALAPLFASLPAGAPPSVAMRMLPGLADRGYRSVAGHRVGISRLVPSRSKRWARQVLERPERS